MEDLLIDILSEFGFPVIRQGSIQADEDYPDHFFTFWNNDTSGDGFYDNHETKTTWDFDVNFYTIDPAEAYSKLREAISKLKHAGFIISGKGYDVGSDEPTHIGRGVNVLYLEPSKL